MKRIIIICEGRTEQSFCNDVLAPVFNQRGIFLETPTIKKNGGGIVPWQALKHQIEKHLLEDSTARVTTFIDYYGLYAHHEYPKWNEAERKTNRVERIDVLEQGMKEDIDLQLQFRFIPYIQLHEFEGLLFSDLTAFDSLFADTDFLDYSYLKSTISENTNPEDINNSVETAPSKRLERILDKYNKVVYGTLLADEIGLSKIREKCPRFNNWIEQLVNI